jgi:hypothetical protein
MIYSRVLMTMVNGIRILLLAAFAVWITPVSAKADEVQESKRLSHRGMALVESWCGDSEVLSKAEKLFNKALWLYSQNVEAITGMGRIATRRGFIGGNRIAPEALDVGLDYANKALSIDKKCVHIFSEAPFCLDWGT